MANRNITTPQNSQTVHFLKPYVHFLSSAVELDKQRQSSPVSTALQIQMVFKSVQPIIGKHISSVFASLAKIFVLFGHKISYEPFSRKPHKTKFYPVHLLQAFLNLSTLNVFYSYSLRSRFQKLIIILFCYRLLLTNFVVCHNLISIFTSFHPLYNVKL